MRNIIFETFEPLYFFAEEAHPQNKMLATFMVHNGEWSGKKAVLVLLQHICS